MKPATLESTTDQKLLSGSKICLSAQLPRLDFLKKIALELGAKLITHISADTLVYVSIDVGTDKDNRKAASTLSVPIVRPSWIEYCSKNRGMQPSNLKESIKDYILLPFESLRISTTQYDSDTKDIIEENVNRLGGKYSRCLTRFCSHLIIQVSKGKKYEYAKRFSIAMVTIEWFETSLRAGVCADESFYSPQEYDLGLTTPTTSDAQSPGVNTQLSFEPKQCRYLLDTKIFLGYGFPHKVAQRFRAIILSAGGILSSECMPDVKYFISYNNTLSCEDMAALRKANFKPTPISCKWLKDCFRNSTLISYDGYMLRLLPEDPSNGQMLCNYGAKTSHSDQATSAGASGRRDSYSNGNNVNIFTGMSFSCDCFIPDERSVIEARVVKYGAEWSQNINDLISSMHRKKFLVLPLVCCKTPEYSHGDLNLVTTVWIVKCIDKGELAPHDRSSLCAPIFSERIPDLNKLVFGISGFRGVERNQVKKLISLSGALVTENFSKSNTHLLCSGDTSSLKLIKALKWNVPVVDMDWLITCYTNGVAECSSSHINDVRHLPLCSTKSEILLDQSGDMQSRCGLAEKYSLPLDNPDVADLSCSHASLFPKNFSSDPTMESGSGAIISNACSSSSISASAFAQIVDQYVCKQEKNNKRAREDIKKEDDSTLDWSSFFKEPMSFLHPNINQDPATETSDENNDTFSYSTDILHMGGTEVVYDDPKGRKLKRKLVERLKKNTERGVLSVDPPSFKDVHGFEPIFMLSGFSLPESESMASCITNLGGKVILSKKWDNRCTHLIANRISAREKCLAAISRGCWILSSEYVHDSFGKKKFLKEEDYEWGEHPSTTTGFGEKAMLLSAKRWRLKLKNYLHRNYNYVGAFDGWIVLLDTSASTTDTLRRVLEAGGAKVFTKDQKSPDDCLEKVEGKFNICITDIKAKTGADSAVLGDVSNIPTTSVEQLVRCLFGEIRLKYQNGQPVLW